MPLASTVLDLQHLVNQKWITPETKQSGDSSRRPAYSNFIYTILGYLKEKVLNSHPENSYGWNDAINYFKSGQAKRWEDYVYKKILLPLGMTDTGFFDRIFRRID